MSIPTFELDMTLTPLTKHGDFDMNKPKYLHVYVSRHVRRRGEFYVKEFTMERMPVNIRISVPCRNSVDVMLGMVCICLMTKNETIGNNSEWRFYVKDHTADVFISIDELQLIKTKQRNPNVIFYDTSSDDPDNTDKLTCSIAVNKINFKWDNGVVKQIRDFKTTEMALQSVRRKMNSYIEEYFENIGIKRRSNRHYNSPLVPHLAQMHVPIYYSLVNMPACTFALRFPIANRDPEYYLYQILKISLSLNGDWPETEMVKTIRRQLNDNEYSNKLDPNIHKVNKVLSNAFCLFGNACEYGADLNGDEDVEKFKIARVMFKIDCEDSAHDCYITANSAIFNRPQYNDLAIAAFDWMQLYAVGMLTTSASTKSLNRNTPIDVQIKESDYVNHICSVMIPRVVLSRWSHGIMGGPFTPQECGGDQNAEVKPFESFLKVIYLEGTNWCYGGLQPYCSYVDKRYEQESIKEWNAVSGIYKDFEKKNHCLSNLPYYIFQPHLKGSNVFEIADDRIVSNFHKYPCSLWLHTFTRYPEKFASKGYKIPVDFHLCDKTENNKYGVSTRKFIDGSGDIFLSPNVEFDTKDMELIADTLSYEYPIETLPGDDVSPVSGFPPDTSKLERLKNLYPLSYQSESYFGLRPMFIQYIINRIEKLTPRIYGCFESILKTKSAHAFDYKLHRISDGRVYIIEIRFYVKNMKKYIQ